MTLVTRSFLLLIPFMIQVAHANQEFFNKEVLDAESMQSSPQSPTANEWNSVKAKTISVYPQTTVTLNDKKANQAVAELKPQKVELKAIYTEQELILRLQWHDESKSVFMPKDINVFGDSFAVEFPENYGEGKRLPYVGMGDEKFNVSVYMSRIAEKEVLNNTYIAAGFGSLTRTDKKSVKSQMEYDEKSKMWTAVMTLPMSNFSVKDQGGLLPFALAVWEGSRNERGGNKMLSSWKFIRLNKFKISDKYVKEMSFGYNPGDLGNPEAGKILVTTACAACHRVAGVERAPVGIAPDLKYIGGISTYAYLRDSIIKPSEVSIRHLNPNRHYDKDQKPAKFRAYVNNESYSWIIKDAKGHATSKMPPFSYLPPKEVANVISYIKSLAVE